MDISDKRNVKCPSTPFSGNQDSSDQDQNEITHFT